MIVKIWICRIFFRWTKKGRAIRKMVRDLGIKEGDAFKLVASIEKMSVDLARQIVEEESQRRATAARSSSRYERPRNQSVAGARLAR